MMHDHFVNFIVADEKVFVCDGAVGARIAIERVGASRPQIRAKNMQVLDLFGVASVQLEELLAAFRNALDLRADGEKYGCFVK